MLLLPKTAPQHREGGVEMVMDNKPMKLEITKQDSGYQIKLDETAIRYVEHYSVDQASAQGKAVLTLKVLVEYP